MREASCSCGQLTLTAEGDPIRISMCHCLACQRRTGSAFGIQARFPADRVRVTGRYAEYVRISAEEYIGVLDTYSPNRAMEPAKRERLFDLIRRRVEACPGGRVRKTYLFTLNLARRLDYSSS